MQYPLTISGVKVSETNKLALETKGFSGNCGDMVAVRPCAEEFEKKTFLGVYIGDIALSLVVGFDPEDKHLIVERSMYNPAIFIPDRNTIVYGAGSWWSKIKDENQLREITDADINNVWYVKALKQLQETTPVED